MNDTASPVTALVDLHTAARKARDEVDEVRSILVGLRRVEGRDNVIDALAVAVDALDASIDELHALAFPPDPLDLSPKGDTQ